MYSYKRKSCGAYKQKSSGNGKRVRADLTKPLFPGNINQIGMNVHSGRMINFVWRL